MRKVFIRDFGVFGSPYSFCLLYRGREEKRVEGREVRRRGNQLNAIRTECMMGARLSEEVGFWGV